MTLLQFYNEVMDLVAHEERQREIVLRKPTLQEVESEILNGRTLNQVLKDILDDYENGGEDFNQLAREWDDLRFNE